MCSSRLATAPARQRQWDAVRGTVAMVQGPCCDSGRPAAAILQWPFFRSRPPAAISWWSSSSNQAVSLDGRPPAPTTCFAPWRNDVSCCCSAASRRVVTRASVAAHCCGWLPPTSPPVTCCWQIPPSIWRSYPPVRRLISPEMHPVCIPCDGLRRNKRPSRLLATMQGGLLPPQVSGSGGAGCK